MRSILFALILFVCLLFGDVVLSAPQELKSFTRYESLNKIGDFVCEISKLKLVECLHLKEMSFVQIFGDPQYKGLNFEHCRYNFERYKLYQIVEWLELKDRKFPDEFRIRILRHDRYQTMEKPIETVRADYCFGNVCHKKELFLMFPCTQFFQQHEKPETLIEPSHQNRNNQFLEIEIFTQTLSKHDNFTIYLKDYWD